MNLWRDFCWWLKHATWAQCDRFVAWYLQRINGLD